MQASATKLSAEEMHSTNGESDFFFGPSPSQVRKQLRVVTGADCGDDADRCDRDGGGWTIVPAHALKDGTADHAFFVNDADVACAKRDCFDPTWEKGNEPWSLGPSLDWLASKVRGATTDAPTDAPLP